MDTYTYMHIIPRVIQLRLFYENDIIISRPGRIMQFNTSMNDGARMLYETRRTTRLYIMYLYYIKLYYLCGNFELGYRLLLSFGIW